MNYLIPEDKLEYGILSVYVKMEHLTDVYVNFNVKVGVEQISYGVAYSEDHPSFAYTRNWLDEKGYLNIDKTSINGDTVAKEFYFNDIFFKVEDRFPCASAMSIHLKHKT